MRQTFRFLLPAFTAAALTLAALTPQSATAGLAWMDDDGDAGALSIQGANAPLVNGVTPPVVIGVGTGFFLPTDEIKLTVQVRDVIDELGAMDLIAGMQFKLNLSALVDKGLQIKLKPLIPGISADLYPPGPGEDPFLSTEVDLPVVDMPPSISLAFIDLSGGFSLDQDLLQLCFSVPAGEEVKVLGLDADVVVSTMELLVSGFIEEPENSGQFVETDVPVSLEAGKLQIGIPGDVNRDGKIDIRDPVVLVGRDLGKLLPDLPIVKNIPAGAPALPDDDPPSSDYSIDGTTDSKILDITGNGFIDVGDVVAIILDILGIDNQTQGKSVASGPAVIDMGSLITMDNGQLAIPVYLEGAGVMAGADVTFSFDPNLVKVGAPVLPDGSGHLGYDHIISEDGTLRTIIYSLSASKGLATGNTPMLLIPVTMLTDTDAQVTLTDVRLANAQAQVSQVEIGQTSQTVNKSAQIPTAFALLNNKPNPFNPSTNIAYEVPQQAHITLTVYNVLGQEVIRLVDQVQAPGRYEVVWNALNAQGARVSSGIYMYNISSSTGFSETKRMTLLK